MNMSLSSLLRAGEDLVRTRPWTRPGAARIVDKASRWIAGESVKPSEAEPEPSIPCFDELGKLVQGRWKARGYETSELPAIAIDALQEIRPDREIDPAAIVRWLRERETLPRQLMAGNFSDFPLQFYVNDRFYIEILFWTNSTTAIHQHSFTGAFHVLAGSSMHAEWGFTESQRHGRVVRTGVLHEKRTDLLRAGETRAIPLGSSFIHSLFHLDQPSVTVVVRTHGIPAAGPQYEYLPSNTGLAVARDPDKSVLLQRKLKCLHMLASAGGPEIDAFITSALASGDEGSALALLQAAKMRIPDPERFAAIQAVARERFGQLMESAIPALAYREWTTRTTASRAKITDPDLRFLVALLLNVRSHEAMVQLTQQRRPGEDARALLTDWTRRAVAIEPSLAEAPINKETGAAIGLVIG